MCTWIFSTSGSDLLLCSTLLSGGVNPLDSFRKCLRHYPGTLWNFWPTKNTIHHPLERIRCSDKAEQHHPKLICTTFANKSCLFFSIFTHLYIPISSETIMCWIWLISRQIIKTILGSRNWLSTSFHLLIQSIVIYKISRTYIIFSSNHHRKRPIRERWSDGTSIQHLCWSRL